MARQSGFMDDEYLEKARCSRQRQVIVYLDGMELTDESKEGLGHKPREPRVREPKREPEYNPLTHQFTFYNE